MTCEDILNVIKIEKIRSVKTKQKKSRRIFRQMDLV